MSQHSPVDPTDCPSCRAVWSVLTAESDPTRLTIAQLMDQSGLGRRAVFIHLSRLVESGRVGPDRRTPESGASLDRQPLRPGPDVTPEQWAASVEVPDQTCLKCLLAYAAHGWRGQINDTDLAAAAGVSVVTVKRHRPHLKSVGLIRFTPDALNGTTGHLIRRPDRYTLVPGLALLTVPDIDPATRSLEWFEAAATGLLEQVRWFTPDRPIDAGRARLEMAAAMRSRAAHGWTEADWLAHLDGSAPRRARQPLAYLRSRLADAPDTPPVNSGAQQLATGLLAGMRDCANPECRTPMRARSPHTHCPTCRADTARAI